jgi:nucleoside-diphosphate-sugar epimerase
MNSEELLSHYTGKRILITGGAGCIGSNLIKALLKAEPEKIVVIDDLSASYEWNIPKDPKVTRYINVYGPGEVPGRYRNVIPNFFWWAMHGQPLPITGTGEETRDFTFVEDIVDGTLRMAS